MSETQQKVGDLYNPELSSLPTAVSDLYKINEDIHGNAFHQGQAQAVQLPVTPDALPGRQWTIAQHLAAQLKLTLLSSFSKPAVWHPACKQPMTPPTDGQTGRLYGCQCRNAAGV